MSELTIDISEQRLNNFRSIAASRKNDVTVVLENVHDAHNIGAILRSCDSVGIDKVYILDTDPRLIDRKLENKGSSTGINKWIQIMYFTDVAKCIKEVKEKYKRLIGTVLEDNATSLYDLQLCDPVALVFGNEKDGITPELQKYLDFNMVIPQVGFAQSLNVSVACAVTLYELYRQRNSQQQSQSLNPETENIYQRYLNIDQAKRLRKNR